MGRAARPALEHRPHDGHDAAPQARRPAADRDGPRERLPRVIPQPARPADRDLRRHLRRLRRGPARRLLLADGAPPRPHARRRSRPTTALAQLGTQYLLALAGATLVADRAGLGARGARAGARCRRPSTRASASWPTPPTSCARPLTVIRTEADVTLANPDADLAELRAMGHEIVGAADEMDALLEGLMVLARSGHGLRRRRVVDLAAAAASRGAARARGRRARAAGSRAGGRTRRAAPARAPGREPDRERRPLQRAGRIRRRDARAPTDGGAVLDVVNSGPRVDPDVAARLIEPFERGGRTGTHGAGLGLSIVRSVAEAHGGTARAVAACRGRSLRPRVAAGRVNGAHHRLTRGRFPRV